MKTLTRLFGIPCILAFLAMASACSTTGNSVSNENLLIAAGFKTKLASTPQQQAHLQTLPPNKLTQVARNGKTYYVFADRANNQLLVGTPGQYQYYRQLKKERNATQQDDTIARMDVDTGQAWSVWGEDWDYPH